MGRVIVSASIEGADSGGLARTILPAKTPDFSRYALVFSRDGYTDITETDTAGLAGSGVSRELAAGTWTATVTAYRAFTVTGENRTEYPAARGDADLTVAAGETTQVMVPIAPIPVTDPGVPAAKGIFTYKITFPAGVSGALTFGNETTITLVSGEEVSVEKTPGYYDLAVFLTKGSLSAGLMEKAHIYAGLESRAEFAFTDADFAPMVYLAGTLSLPEGITLTGGNIKAYSNMGYTGQIGQTEASESWVIGVPASYIGSTLYLKAVVTGQDGKTYTGMGDSGDAVPEAGARSITIAADDRIKDIADASAYLSAVAGGQIADDPAPLPVALKLTDTMNGWMALLSAINAAGKYVALDLSACAMSGAVFDPGEANTGEELVVSLVLPDEAASIKAGTTRVISSYVHYYPTFQYFTALRSISGDNIITVGNYAFYRCEALTAVSFPAATSIGEEAFSGCESLATVSLPAATSLGGNAFDCCYSLTSVDLPKVTSIGSQAFWGCEVLETVNLPAATTIGEGAFMHCAALTTVNIPKVTTIGDGAFAACRVLTAVNLPATLSTIEANPFWGCTILTSITVDSANPKYKGENGMLLNKAGTTLIAYPTAQGEVTLNTITTIGDGAFSICRALTAVNLPKATSIGREAFGGCESLTTANLPKAMSIGMWAFESCEALETVNIPKVASIDFGAFSVFYGSGGTALTITMGSTAPTLENDMFFGTPRTVTVRVTSGATGYGTVPATYSGTNSDRNWGNGFRGGGWSGTAFVSGSYDINSDITLHIVYQ
jgi:hypothetical protein